MRSFRLICALVLAVGLAILPVSAAFAMSQAQTHAGMSDTGDDCPCCKPAQQDGCLLKCCHVQALIVDGFATTRPGPISFLATGADRFMAFAPRPDPPPPRS